MPTFIEISKKDHERHLGLVHEIKEKFCELAEDMTECFEHTTGEHFEERRGRSGYRRGVRGTGRMGRRHYDSRREDDDYEMDDRYDY